MVHISGLIMCERLLFIKCNRISCLLQFNLHMCKWSVSVTFDGGTIHQGSFYDIPVVLVFVIVFVLI